MMYHGPIEVSCAAALGVSVDDLAQRLSPLAEFGLGEYAKSFEDHGSARTATLASAILQSKVLPGQPHIQIVQRLRQNRPYKHLLARAHEYFGPVPGMADIIYQIALVVGWPEDLQATREAVAVYDAGPGSATRRALLDALIAAEKSADGVKLARLVSGPTGKDEARALLGTGALPEWLETCCLWAGNWEMPSIDPILRVACLTPPVAILVAFLLEVCRRDPAKWASAKAVFPHLERLQAVMGLVDPPSLNPGPEALGRLHLDVSLAAAYDALLFDEARGSDEDVDDAASTRKAMRGFQLTCSLLEAARGAGAPIGALPKGLHGRWGTTQWQSMRPDLTPDPECYRELLAWLSACVADEDAEVARLVLLDKAVPSRPHVVLTLEQRGWVEEPEGVVLHIRPDALHKVGRGVTFLAKAFRDQYGIGAHWLPEETPATPSPAAIHIFDECTARALGRFTEQTGRVLPAGHYVSRRGLVQLLRQSLTAPDQEFISAFLDHRSPGSRSNYQRVLPGDELATRSLLRDHRG